VLAPQHYHRYAAILDSPSPEGNYSWVIYSIRHTEVSTSAVISACWRLMRYDVKINGAQIRTMTYGSESDPKSTHHHSASNVTGIWVALHLYSPWLCFFNFIGLNDVSATFIGNTKLKLFADEIKLYSSFSVDVSNCRDILQIICFHHGPMPGDAISILANVMYCLFLNKKNLLFLIRISRMAPNAVSLLLLQTLVGLYTGWLTSDFLPPC